MLDRFGGSVMITIGILSLLTLAIVVSWAFARRRRKAASSRRDDIPLFTIPVSELAVPIGRPPVFRGVQISTPSALGSYSRPSSRPMIDDSDIDHPLGRPTVRTRDGSVSTATRATRSAPVHEQGGLPDDEVGEPVEGASVRYWRAADGTLQFLPGRLAISAGKDAGHEIRFVRTSGPDGTMVTFGRADGAPYRHVQLREPTVSRIHARMSLESNSLTGAPNTGSGGQWHLENLSTTNPVMVNGRALGRQGTPQSSVILSDGDRIEMGEVAFVFHAR
jgi:hypothetical protein